MKPVVAVEEMRAIDAEALRHGRRGRPSSTGPARPWPRGPSAHAGRRLRPARGGGGRQGQQRRRRAGGRGRACAGAAPGSTVVDAADAPDRIGPRRRRRPRHRRRLRHRLPGHLPGPGGARRRAACSPSTSPRVWTATPARRAASPLRADVTVTFAALKTGLAPGRRPPAGRTGRGGRHRPRRRAGPALWVVEDADVARLLAPRPRDAHKWQSAVAVVAGLARA